MLPLLSLTRVTFLAGLPLIAAAGCATTPPPPAASAAMLEKVRALAPYPCNAATAAALEANGVTPDRLLDLYYVRQSSGGEASVLINHQAWVQVAGEPTQTVVQHSNTCHIQQVYKR
ncbi:MAG: hypothetical protein KIT81_04370 [Alphaproteobacteria bacterium]|nr:hypothetical protein [Alphaproteobacteria bacterium]